MTTWGLEGPVVERRARRRRRDEIAVAVVANLDDDRLCRICHPKVAGSHPAGAVSASSLVRGPWPVTEGVIEARKIVLELAGLPLGSSSWGDDGSGLRSPPVPGEVFPIECRTTGRRRCLVPTSVTSVGHVMRRHDCRSLGADADLGPWE
jgi:hypothetical protein